MPVHSSFEYKVLPLWLEDGLKIFVTEYYNESLGVHLLEILCVFQTFFEFFLFWKICGGNSSEL